MKRTEWRAVLDENDGRALLVVCAANVCRSPLAEYLLGRALSSLPEFEGHSSSSAGAGVDAVNGVAICERVAEHIGASGADFARAHRTRVLDAGHVRSASLILTASKVERSAVARLDPSARARTFTVREAAALMNGSAALPPADARASVFERFAAAANARRGLIVPAVPIRSRRPARWLFGRDSSDPLDVPDGHTRSRREHLATIADVADAVEGIVAGLRRVAG
jgi:protein-tyrosine phosphatase